MGSFFTGITGPDVSKQVLLEVRAGQEIETMSSWTSAGGGAYFEGFVMYPFAVGLGGGYGGGEIVEMKENGVAYARKTDLAGVQATAGSFWHDPATAAIYVHTSGGDSPSTKVLGVYKYTIVAYFYFCFCDDSPTSTPATFIPNFGDADYAATLAVPYMPMLKEGTIPTIKMSVGDFNTGDFQIQAGQVSINNDGWWYEALQYYLWHNAETRMLIGTPGSAYSTFDILMVGILERPQVDDNEARFDFVDARAILKEIPLATFDKTTYTNLEDSGVGRSIPIQWGEISHYVPVCIDTVNHIYKPAGHALEDITAVYVDKVPQVLGLTFTKDLPNGQFTLTFDPGTRLVECDLKGAKCEGDFTGAAAVFTGDYSENPADVLLDLLYTYNGIALSRIDCDSFLTLQGERAAGQTLAAYISLTVDSPTQTGDIIRKLQMSALFQYTQLANGLHAGVVYGNTMTGSEPSILTDDIDYLAIRYETKKARKIVSIKYARDAQGTFKYASYAENEALYRYMVTETLEIETALRDENQALAYAVAYLGFISQPPVEVDGTFSPAFGNLVPTNKFYLSKAAIGYEGRAVWPFALHPFRVVSIEKDVRTLKPKITATRVWTA